MEEKREYFRYKLSFPAEYQPMNSSQHSYTVTKDLSLGGVKIVSDDFVAKGQTLKLKINLIKQIFNFKTKVAWCNRKRFSDRYHLGCEFVEVPQFHKIKYRKFLNTIATN
ncbi:MAG: PilZ domain-containing protein [Candidatus Omnitrophica bacterium]|nr:PilZ domain-containing protein [Candidatus Omnitrophota bacterium]MCF7894072.1 PilZ domain-containing protein [Candidatus Omnitrophota bacterium]